MTKRCTTILNANNLTIEPLVFFSGHSFKCRKWIFSENTNMGKSKLTANSKVLDLDQFGRDPVVEIYI